MEDFSWLDSIQIAAGPSLLRFTQASIAHFRH